MEAYGKAAFDELGADALTVVPYMGADVVRPLYPWLEKGHGVYSVFLSSNSSGNSRQRRQLENNKQNLAEFFHEEIFAELAEKNLSSALGLVVGATVIQEQSDTIKKYIPSNPFLIPGLGFQGGELGPQLEQLNKGNKTYLLPMSRSISGFGDQKSFAELQTLSTFTDYKNFVQKRIQDTLKQLAS